MTNDQLFVRTRPQQSGHRATVPHAAASSAAASDALVAVPRSAGAPTPAFLATHELEYAQLPLPMPLHEREIPTLRRLINRFVGGDNDLFHNHRTQQGGYHYRYPLVQYKTIEGQATVWGMGETGVAALHQLTTNASFRAQWLASSGAEPVTAVEHLETLLLHTHPRWQYHLRQYIALNNDNRSAWNEKPGLAARATLLERCLTGHILKFCSAIRWQLPPHSLLVELTDYRARTVKSFDNSFLAFDVAFRTNITLPEGIGLGKAVSHGFGVLSAD